MNRAVGRRIRLRGLPLSLPYELAWCMLKKSHNVSLPASQHFSVGQLFSTLLGRSAHWLQQSAQRDIDSYGMVRRPLQRLWLIMQRRTQGRLQLTLQPQ